MFMHKHIMKAHNGVGLIEVLVAAVVIAVGLLAVASLQGGLMRSSGESKTRAEAIKLAEQKIEEVRNNIIKSNYDGRTTNNDYPVGSNASFTRTWTISDAISPDRKNINVNVKWGGSSVNETVSVVSQLVWADPGRATDYSTGGNGLSAKAPSPNNNSSSTPGITLTAEQMSAATALGDGSGLSKYIDTTTNEIYLADSTGNAKIKFHGGVIHTIKGNVYTGNVGNGKNPSVSLSSLTSYPVTFSDLAYCVFPVTQNHSDYICYFGGDCTNGGEGCSSTPSGSPAPTYTAVSGGWYGKVGLIETSSANFQNKKVCFAEDLASNVALSGNTSARYYSTERLNATNTIVNSEGINQSFECQDFLVVGSNGSGNDCHYFQGYSGLYVPSSSIHRQLTSTALNASLAVDQSSCGTSHTYIISGTINGSLASDVVVSVNYQECPKTNVSGSCNYSYHCSIPTSGSTLNFTASGGGASTSDSTTLSTSGATFNQDGSYTVAGAPTYTAGDPSGSLNYHVTGTIIGNGKAYVAVTATYGSTTATCNVDQSYNYDCGFTSTPTSVTINAAFNPNQATGSAITLATGSPAQTVTLGCGANALGPNFNATIPRSESYTIDGTIGGPQASSVNISMSDGGACTKLKSTTYHCTITTIPKIVTISASGGGLNTSETVTLDGITLSPAGPTFTTSNYSNCQVRITGNITKGTASGAKLPTSGTVAVTHTNTGTPNSTSCTITTISGTTTYACPDTSSYITVSNNGSITIGGTKVSGGVVGPFACTSSILSNSTLNITTTN